MISYNRVILSGKVAVLPQRHYRPDGSPVVQFPLELNGSESPSGKTSRQDGWGGAGRSLVTIVAFGKLAEFKFEHLQSSQRLLVVGRLHQRRWQTPEGKKQTVTEVIATDLRTIEEIDQTIEFMYRGE